MNENKQNHNFIGYDYKEVGVWREHMSLYIDGYKSFGWIPDESFAQRGTNIRLKRDRKIVNKVELIRLERNFEACMSEIEALERAKTSVAAISVLSIGVIGTVFMAGSVFAVTHEPPVIWLTALLGLLGVVGWALPPLLYKTFVGRSTKKLMPLIEAKYDEIYEVCEKGNRLLHS